MKTMQAETHPRVTIHALAATLLMMCVLLAGSLKAQESKSNSLGPPGSSIKGVVNAIGPKGQATPLEGISLKLSGESLGEQSLSTVTDAAGHYEFNRLGAGSYSLEASLEGFKLFAKSLILKQNETLVE